MCNQVTNKIPYGLLSKEEQAQFLPESRRLYEVLRDFHGKGLPIWKSTSQSPFPQRHQVYRLIIKDDEWYYVESMQGHGLILTGRELEGRITGGYDTLRPANAEEIEAAKPKELTLEEKVKAKYPDFEVKFFRWCSVGRYVFSTSNDNHIAAQSMKGFYRYVYQHLDGDWDTSTSPTMMWDKGVTLQPIAVLFNK